MLSHASLLSPHAQACMQHFIPAVDIIPPEQYLQASRQEQLQHIYSIDVLLARRQVDDGGFVDVAMAAYCQTHSCDKELQSRTGQTVRC